MSTLRSTIELAPNEKNAANEEPSEENEECILLGLHIYDPDHACAHSLWQSQNGATKYGEEAVPRFGETRFRLGRGSIVSRRRCQISGQ